MTTQKKRNTHSKKWHYYVLLLAITLYNAWILSVFINPHAFLAGATTSELEVWGQPGALFFRCTDILAGLLFLAGAPAITKLARSKKARLLLRTGIISLGLSTIIEALVVLNCSSALDMQCAMREQLNTLGWQHEFHIIESIVAYSLLVLLPIGTLIAVRTNAHARRLKYWSVGLVIFMTGWALASIVQFADGADSYGLGQALFNVIFAVWFIQAICFGDREKT